MPKITITLTDTPEGSVACHGDFSPAVGQRLSPAQCAAMDIIMRTNKQWGMPGGVPPVLTCSAGHPVALERGFGQHD